MICIRCKKVLLTAARAHVVLDTSDFSLLFAEAAVGGLILYGAPSPRVEIYASLPWCP